MEIITLILAAGSSSRMGQPKQLLPWKNTTLLGHAIATAQAVKGSRIVVVLGAHATRIQKTIEPSVPVIENPDWKQGLGNSLAFGVKHVTNNNPNTQGILVMLADQPLIDTAYLNEMLTAFFSQNPKIVATAYPKKQGVPAIFDVSLFNELMELNRDQGAGTLIGRYTSESIVLHSNRKTYDIDTMEDYNKLLGD